MQLTGGLTSTCCRPDQLWLIYQLESAQNRPFLSSEANWTATYRRDSTLVTPYGWWRPSEDSEEDAEDENTAVTADFAGAREGRVAWFVSNCAADNQRLEYGRALGGSYPVDVYGKCGELRCSRVRREQYSTVQCTVCSVILQGTRADCWKMVAKKYKYYLAFENSNCVDYITEKFWDALKYKVSSE